MKFEVYLFTRTLWVLIIVFSCSREKEPTYTILFLDNTLLETTCLSSPYVRYNIDVPFRIGGSRMDMCSKARASIRNMVDAPFTLAFDVLGLVSSPK
jgi:hypothetical protein